MLPPSLAVSLSSKSVVFDSRFHCEGRIVTTLFGLLFWDVIFAPIPGAFETPFQSAPLDLVEDTFFYSRQDLIEARLEEIRSDKAAEILERTFDANTNVMCVGVRWDLFQKEDLLGIVRVSVAHAVCCSLTHGVLMRIVCSVWIKTCWSRYVGSCARTMVRARRVSRI